MQPISRIKQEEFDYIIPSIEEAIDKWQVVSIAINENCELPYDEIVAKILDIYNGVEGIVYSLGYFRVIAIVKLGYQQNYAQTRKDLAANLPEQNLFLNFRKLTHNTLKFLQSTYMMPNESKTNLFELRAARQEKKFLIADDSLIDRKVLGIFLKGHANNVNVESGDEVLSAYLDTNPDVLFLDLHMPGKSGMEIIDEILEFDLHAFIIVCSADRSMEQILKAVEKGAVGFIAKPPQKDKIFAYIRRCITIPKAK